MRYDTIIFDLDGTLLDSLQDLAASVNHALALHGLPGRTLEEIRTFVGNGVGRLMELSAGFKASDSRYPSLLADFKAHYALHCGDATSPYQGIPALLAELKARGIRLAVVSNKEDREVHALVEKHFPGIFNITAGEKPGIARKPAPDSVLHVMQKLAACKSLSIYIGDSDVDVRTAQNAGIDMIAVTWGYRSEDQLIRAGARTLVDTPKELLACI